MHAAAHCWPMPLSPCSSSAGRWIRVSNSPCSCMHTTFCATPCTCNACTACSNAPPSSGCNAFESGCAGEPSPRCAAGVIFVYTMQPLMKLERMSGIAQRCNMEGCAAIYQGRHHITALHNHLSCLDTQTQFTIINLRVSETSCRLGLLRYPKHWYLRRNAAKPASAHKAYEPSHQPTQPPA